MNLRCAWADNGLAIIDTGGIVMPCCQIRGDHGKNTVSNYPNVSRLTTLNEVHDSNSFRTIRKKLKTGDNHECSSCWHIEQAGKISRREFFLSSKYYTGGDGIKFMELMLDSTCNMMCKMCKPTQSSKWASAKKLLSDLDTIDTSNEGHHIMTGSSVIKNLFTVLENTDLSKLVHINIVGGEPFYSKNFIKLLRLLDKKRGLENIHIGLNTNSSIFPNNELLKLLVSTKALRIKHSLDAVGNLASYIRHGMPWNLIENNVKKFIKLRKKYPNITLVISSVVSVMNMNHMQDLADFAHDNGLTIDSYMLEHPKYFSIYNIPIDYRKKYLLDKTKRNYNKHIQGWADDFNNQMLYERDWDKTGLSMQILNTLDKHQNSNFAETNPEMYNTLLKLAKK